MKSLRTSIVVGAISLVTIGLASLQEADDKKKKEDKRIPKVTGWVQIFADENFVGSAKYGTGVTLFVDDSKYLKVSALDGFKFDDHMSSFRASDSIGTVDFYHDNDLGGEVMSIIGNGKIMEQGKLAKQHDNTISSIEIKIK